MPSDKLDPPSELFWDCVTSGGSPVIDCGFCGRVHFATGGNHDGDDDEIAELREKAKANPDKYVEDSSNDSVAWGYLAGCEAVWNCPCNHARKYENFIWAHRQMIVRYINARAANELKEAQRNAELAASVLR